MVTGGTELLVVLAIAVLLFGPKKLPELARSLGQAMGEYHRAQREFEMEMKKTTGSIDKEITSVTNVEPKKAAPKAIPPGQPSTNIPKVASSEKTLPSKGSSQSKTVKDIAKNMGISTADKSDEQLLAEISTKTKKKTPGEE